MYIIYSYVVHLDYSYNHIYKIITWVKHESDILRDDFCHHGEFVVSWPQQDITGLPNHVWWISAWQKLSGEARAIHDARTIGTHQGDEPIQPVKPLESHLVDHWAMKKKYHSFSHLMKYSWSLLVYSLQLSPINGFYSPRTQVVQLPNQSTTRPASVGQESAHPLLDVAGHVQVLSAGGLHPSIYPRYP